MAASTVVYQNPGGEPMAMGMEPVVLEDHNGNVTVRNINGVNLNPHRRRRKMRRHHYRMEMENPDSGMMRYMQTMDNPSNPDFGDQLINGSTVTQDISPVDVGVATISFLFNNWLSRQIGITGVGGVVVSAIIPFITGAAASMLHSRFGSAFFIGGELDASLKIMAKIPGLNAIGGMHESGNGDWVLQSLPKVNFSFPAIPGMTAHVTAQLPPAGAAAGAAAAGGAAHAGRVYNLRYNNPSNGEIVYRE